MTLLQLFETICGIILIFVGWRFTRDRKIPVVSEGSLTPAGWITGMDAVIAGVLVIGMGVALIAVAAGLLKLP